MRRLKQHRDLSPVECRTAIRRIMCFIQYRFPEKEGGMVTMYTDHVSYIRIDPFAKERFFVPELPARHFDQGKQPQLVASIHKSRINHIMGTNHLQPGIPQLFCIPPLHRVGQCVAQDSKILVPVGSHQFAFIRFPLIHNPIVLLSSILTVIVYLFSHYSQPISSQ